MLKYILEDTKVQQQRELLSIGSLLKFSDQIYPYYGLDLSNDQLNIAKNKINSNNVEFMCCSAENIPLEDNSIDVIISTWVLGTILEIDRRNKVLDEMKRVLKRGGNIYLVENDIGGEFEKIRNRYPNIERTKQYNDWIESNNFKIESKFRTYFQFKNYQEAKNTFSNIWGDEKGDKVKSSTIEQNIIIYNYQKI